jgi:hypothetical protein
MANEPFLVSTYARNIYLIGKERFTARDGCKGIPAGYVADVKDFAAKNYFIDDIDHALANGWITAEEHQQTLDLKTSLPANTGRTAWRQNPRRNEVSQSGLFCCPEMSGKGSAMDEMQKIQDLLTDVRCG